MRSAYVEASIIAWFAQHLEGEERFARGIQLHVTGTRFEERADFIVWPRIASVERRAPSRFAEELDRYVLETNVYVKIQPKGLPPGALSNLVDECRRLVDATQGAPAQIVRNEKEVEIAKCTFTAAQETRLYDQTVTIGSVSMSGIDLCQLRTVCVISPVKPRVPRRPS